MRFWRGINVKGIFGQHFLDFRNICHWNHIHPLSIHPSIVCNCFIPFMGSRGVLLEPIPAVSGRGQGTPWTSCQLIAGPSLMAEAATQAATSGAIWGSVSFAWSLQHEAQLSPGEPGFEPATLWSLAVLLYPLSYSRPNHIQFNQSDIKNNTFFAALLCHLIINEEPLSFWLLVKQRRQY